MSRVLALTALVPMAALTACGGADGASAPPGAGTAPAATYPAPDAEISEKPAALADDLKRTTAGLRDAIDAWAGGKPPIPVVRLALHQQRIYRHLARSKGLASDTVPLLARPIAAEAKDNIVANRSLFSLATPVKPDKADVFKTGEPPPAHDLQGHMKRAERKFGVDWEVLAAIMHVETNFGRIKSSSHAGAQGPMQFMPATWKTYGMGGNVRDTEDAIMGAANYLKSSGAPRRNRRALHAYNPDKRYVDAVSLQARQMKRDPRSFFAYYNWQVYVRTTMGDVRLTGP